MSGLRTTFASALLMKKRTVSLTASLLLRPRRSFRRQKSMTVLQVSESGVNERPSDELLAAPTKNASLAVKLKAMCTPKLTGHVLRVPRLRLVTGAGRVATYWLRKRVQNRRGLGRPRSVPSYQNKPNRVSRMYFRWSCNLYFKKN